MEKCGGGLLLSHYWMAAASAITYVGPSGFTQCGSLALVDTFA